MKAIVWLTQAQRSLVSRPRYRVFDIGPTGENCVVTIGDQRCAVSVDAFHEWCIGPISYCVVNLGADVGSMHGITRRYATDLQRLRLNSLVNELPLFARNENRVIRMFG